MSYDLSIHFRNTSKSQIYKVSKSKLKHVYDAVGKKALVVR